MQLELEYNGVASIGSRLWQINYPNDVTSVESLYVLRQSAYLAATSAAGGLYGCNLDSVNVERLLRNSSDSCKEIRRLYGYEGNIVFTDNKDQKVKTFNPLSATVETLLGTGHEGTVDGTEESCSFTQFHAICSLQKIFFVSDIAAETIKLASGLTGKVSFLRNLECLYDSFGIGAHTIDAVQLSLQDAVCNVSSVNAYIKNTVAEVRQHYKMKETATINGPEGTVSSKTQESLVLLERGMEQLRDNVKNVNEDYLGDIDLRTLLTTQVENLHAVSHFKNETFTAPQYAQDFGTISKESLKRTTKWGAKYFTLEKSYYPVPKSSVELRDVDLMKPPPADNVDPNIEAAMKELVDRYRPVKDGKKRINKRQSRSPAASCIFQYAIVYQSNIPRGCLR